MVKILALISKFTGKEPLLSQFNIDMMNRNNEVDCSKAERELGYHCRPFSESIRGTVDWMREEGFLDASVSWRLLSSGQTHGNSKHFLWNMRRLSMKKNVIKDLVVLWLSLIALCCAALNLYISLNMLGNGEESPDNWAWRWKQPAEITAIQWSRKSNGCCTLGLDPIISCWSSL